MTHPLTKTEKSKIYRMVVKAKKTGKLYFPKNVVGFTNHAARENWYILNYNSLMWEEWDKLPKHELKLNPDFKKQKGTIQGDEDER